MSQQDAAKQQANTRNNIRVVSIFTAAAIGLVGVLVILYAGNCRRSLVIASLPTTPMCAGRPPLLARKVNGYITAVNVKDFAIVQPGGAVPDRRSHL